MSRCKCDYEAHNYTFSWEPKPDWSSVYAGASEVREYFESFSNKHELHRYFQLEKEVVGAKWNSKDGTWEVQVRDVLSNEVISDVCGILINACGVLNSWRWPKIEGLTSFEGPLLHSAKWDSDVNFSGKRVGLIGNGWVAPSTMERI